MKTEDQIQYWIEVAEYDFATAKVMHKSKRYLYVGFMCHQVIEKIIKAYFVFKKSETPPYSHNIAKLAELAELYNLMSDENKDFLDELLPLNIEARYPTHKDDLYNRIDKNYSNFILMKTEEILLWIKTMLSKN